MTTKLEGGDKALVVGPIMEELFLPLPLEDMFSQKVLFCRYFCKFTTIFKLNWDFLTFFRIDDKSYWNLIVHLFMCCTHIG